MALRALPIRHGKHRLLDRLAPVRRGQGAKWSTMPYRGARLRLDAADLVGYHFLQLGSFDPEVIDILSACATGDDLLWDVGANFGAASYGLLGVIDGLRVVAIEPQPALVEVLRENLDALAPGRCRVEGAALGDEPGELKLAVPKGNRGQASLVARHGGDADRFTVPVRTAEQIRAAGEGTWPTLIKIDVEGFEPQVIRSLAPALESGIPRAMVFEHHLGMDPTMREIIDRLAQSGYRVFLIHKTPFATVLCDPAAPGAGGINFAAIRRDLCPPDASRVRFNARDLRRA